MKKWIIATVAVGTFALAAVAYAQPGPAEPRGPRDDHPFPGEGLLENRELIEELDLNEDQVTTLKAIHREAQKASIELKAQQALAQVDLKAELDSDTPNADAVMDAVERAGVARTELRKQQVGAMLKTREVLGAETWQELQERMRNRVRERAETRRERFGDRVERPRSNPTLDGDRPFRRPRPDRPGWEEGPPPAER